MKKKSLLFILMFANVLMFAQSPVYRVFVLNEGYFNWSTMTQVVSPSVGAYNPVTKQYNTIATFNNASFASDVITDGNNLYVAASDGIYLFDKITNTQLDFEPVIGIRKLSVWNNQLLCTRGDVGLPDNYFQVYDKTNLNLIYQLDKTTGPAYTTEGIVVANDTAYIAMNNAFYFPNYVGKIGKVYLPSQTYTNEIDLGADGLNPDYLTYDNNTHKVITLNNLDFTNASVSTYDNNTGAATTTKLNVGSGCASSVYANAGGDIFYQVSGESDLKKFNIATNANNGSLQINNYVYGMGYDATNDLIYAGNTDYVSFGKVYVYPSNSNIPTDSFNVSVSPGTIFVDYSSSTSMSENNTNSFNIFPNPANEIITVSNLNNASLITISDVAGKNIIQQKVNNNTEQINISALLPGYYIVSLETSNGITKQPLLKK